MCHMKKFLEFLGSLGKLKRDSYFKMPNCHSCQRYFFSHFEHHICARDSEQSILETNCIFLMSHNPRAVNLFWFCFFPPTFSFFLIYTVLMKSFSQKEFQGQSSKRVKISFQQHREEDSGLLDFASLFGLSLIFRRLDEFDSASTFVVPLLQRSTKRLVSLST